MDLAGLEKISVIIPLAPGDALVKGLLEDLTCYKQLEILVVGPKSCGKLLQNCRWIPSPLGRAKQMNLGGRHSSREYLWFLHADTRVCANNLVALAKSIDDFPVRTLHYFELGYSADGPSLMILNAWGANMRSKYLQLPYGDQGFCVPKKMFEDLGGFEENAVRGEDFYFIKKLLRRGFLTKCVPSRILTSARKYRKNGWLKTTLNHVRFLITHWMGVRS